MRLRGVLWKPGVNGLGVWGVRWLPYKRKFDVAARSHDRAYDVGGDDNDRKKADKAFFNDILPVCTDGWQLLLATFYYCMVRAFGWMFFRYDE